MAKKVPNGRPRKGADKRTKLIMVSLTEAERTQLDKARGTVPAAVYLREKALSS